METYIKRFADIKAAYDVNSKRDRDLICKTGFYGNCPVIKLQKAAWTNDSMSSVPNKTGIFFSIWLDEESLRRGEVKYNIHSLKLRLLKKYNATSINFARDFRKLFKSHKKDWPNVSVDFGPLTLMQGWIKIVENTFEKDVMRMMNRFGNISPIIDRLLSKSILH